MGKPSLGVFYWHNPTRLGNLGLVNELRKDYTILLISNEPQPHLKGFCDDLLVNDFGNKEPLIKQLEHYQRHKGLDGLITLSEGAVTLLADAQESLDLPGNPPEKTRFARNKAIMRELFDKLAIPSPASYRAHNEAEAHHIANKQFDNQPYFLKAPCIGGSAYCTIITSKEQLKEIWTTFYEESKQRTVKDPLFKELFGQKGSHYYLLLEELLGGTKLPYDTPIGEAFPHLEVSVEGFIQQDTTTIYSITDKPLPTKGLRYSEEYLWRMHSRIPPNLKEILITRVNTINKGLGAVMGCSHTEFRIEETDKTHADIIHDNKAYRARIIETALRIGGAYMQPALITATGFNAIKAMAKQACGQEPNEQVLYRKPLIMGNIWPSQPGKLASVKGLEQLFTLKERFGGAHLYDSIGETIALPPQASRAIGDFIIYDPAIDLTKHPGWETMIAGPYQQTEELFLKAMHNIKAKTRP